MKNAIVFAQYTVKGMRDPWYIDENAGAVYLREWNEVLRIIDDGTPRKMVIYPNAESQVLDNSKDYYPRQD